MHSNYLLIIPVVLLWVILYHVYDAKRHQDDTMELHTYINKLADFEATEIVIGLNLEGWFHNALLFNENNGELMMVEKDTQDHFYHTDYHINELVQSEIRMNGLVVSSIHCTSMTSEKFRDLENALQKEMFTRNDVKQMFIRVLIEKDHESYTYDIPLINSSKCVSREVYLDAKKRALQWQYAFSKQCYHERVLQAHPEQLTIEGLQEKLGIESRFEFV